MELLRGNLGNLPVPFDPEAFFIEFFKIPRTATSAVKSVELGSLTTNAIGRNYGPLLMKFAEMLQDTTYVNAQITM
jgi:hypothetical protein